jgi:ABC-type branched-subunit amino acid transport system ATPase component
MPDDSYLHGDRSATVDLLERGRFSALLAEDILAAPSAGGFVFAVMGPYGSGKTTVLDQVRAALDEKATIVSFEPWMVGSADQLIGRFFKTFAASMKRSARREIREVAERAEKYGQLAGPLSDAVGLALDLSTAGMAGRAKKLARSVLDATKTDVEGERAEIVKALAKADSKWVVFLDDVDRLTSAEIREVIRLVKNVADFPNTVFVLAFDRWNVEHALSGTVRDGREYLEKIIQAPHDLPAVAPHLVRGIIGREITHALSRRGLRMTEADEDRWAKLYEIGVVPYLRTLRLAHQWANVAPLRAAAAGPDVSLPDVLAIEALRVFEPDLFAYLDLSDVLAEYTSLVDSISERHAEERRQHAMRAMEHATRHEVAQALLIALFPQMALYFTGEAGSRDNREDRRLGRLASDKAYWAYATATERDKGPVPALLDAMDDEDTLKPLLDAIDANQLDRVLDELRDYAGDFRSSAAAPFARALCSQLDRTAAIRSDFLGIPLGHQVMTVVELFVGKLDVQQQHDLAHELATTGTPFCRFWVIRTFGDDGEVPEPNQTPPVLAAAETEDLKQKLAEDVAAMPIAELLSHPQFLLFLDLLHARGNTARVVEVFRDDDAGPAAVELLLERWSTTNGKGERVLAELRFKWDVLVNLVGGEAEAEAVIAKMDAQRDTLSEGQLEALDQAKHHRGGRKVLPFETT